MKKQQGRRLISVFLSVVMLLTMLPTGVLADSSSMVTAKNYEELVSYLNNTSVEQITIAGRDWDAYAGVYRSFGWPEGPVTLNLDKTVANTSCDIFVQGPWTIPSNVTVNVGRQLVLQYEMNGSPSITVNGTWNINNMDGQVFAHSSYGYAKSLTIGSSGTLTAPRGGFNGYVAPVAGDAALKLNGSMDLNGHAATVNTWLLGSDAAISSDSVLYMGSGAYLACPEGGAEIECELIAGTNGMMQTGTATMGGSFTTKEIMLDQGGELVIEEGAHITTEKLYSGGAAYGEKLTVNGTLELADRTPLSTGNPVTHLFSDNVTMDIASGGALILRPGNWLSFADEETAAITGSGAVKLYALYDEENGGFSNHPAVFGYTKRQSGEPHQVAETVTISNNWSLNCDHSWELTPVGVIGGENLYACTVCGTEKLGGSAGESGGESGGTDIPGGGESGDLHTLTAPTNVRWGNCYYKNGTKFFHYPGMVSWTVTDTEYAHKYRVSIYKEGETEAVWENVVLYRVGWKANYSLHDFSYDVVEEIGSGNYYFTVQALGDGETTTGSPIVTSDVWEYTKPAKQLAPPSGSRWDDGTVRWDEATDPDAGGYSIAVYYSKTIGNATDADIDDLSWTDDRFVWYFGGGTTDHFYEPSYAMETHGAGYYYYELRTVSGDLNKARHSEYSALSEAYYYGGAEGYELCFEYDPELCGINVYDWYDEEMTSIANGGMLPINPEAGRAYGVFEITNIAEGYRIAQVYMNGADVTERFVKGGYGGCTMTITEDVVLEVYLEEEPEELPVITGAEIYTSFAGIWGEEPLTEIEFTEGGQNRLEARVEYETGSGYPAYYASGLWQYSTDDGATWNDLRDWGVRTDFKPDWSGFLGMDIDFVSDSYLLRMKLVPVQHYSVLKNGGPVYTDAIAVNGNPLPAVPAVNDISFSVVGSSNDGITMNWTMETPEEGEPTLDAIDSLEFWMLNSTTGSWQHFYTGYTDESCMSLSKAIAGSDLPGGEYTRIRVWSMANGYDENENEVADAKYEQDISLTITREATTDGFATARKDLDAKTCYVTMNGLITGLETVLHVWTEEDYGGYRLAEIRVAKAAGRFHTTESWELYDLSEEELAAAWYTLSQVATSVTGATEAKIIIMDLSGWKQFDGTVSEECEHTGVSTSCGLRPVCTKCGESFGEPLQHSWKLASDVGSHWYQCERCGMRDGNYAPHVYEDVKDCTAEIRCAICDYLVRAAKEHEPRGGNSCTDTIICLLCSAVISEPTGHEWGGYSSEQYWHYRECVNCSAWEEGEHVSGNSTDCTKADICTVCEYVIRLGGDHIPGECVSAGDSWHQVKCASCGTNMYMGGHNYGENANCETGMVCEDCGYVKAAPGSHTVPDEYDYGSYQHWKYCSVCYTELEKENHTIVTDPYVPPTSTTPGKTEGSHCSVCGYVKVAQETIPVVAEQEVYWLLDSLEWTYGKVGTVYNEAWNDTDGGSELVYSGDNDSVALVDPETGMLTIVGAGTATITATAAAVPGKFMEASASYVLTVNKAPLTVTPNPVDIIYGMAPFHDGYTAEGFVLGENESVLKGTPVYSFNYQQYDTVGEGEYAIKVTGLSADNYEITFEEGILCVEKAEQYTITLGNLTQSAGKTAPVAAVTDPQDSTAKISIEYLVNGEWTAEQPETAGSYEVRAALVSSENIVPDGSYTTATLTIKPSSTVGNTSVSTEKDENGSAKIEVTEEDLEEIIENIPEDGSLNIDVSDVEDAETVVLPADLIQSLDGSDKVEQLNITSDSASISMGGEVLSTMADAITGEDDTVALQMTSVEEEELTEEQKEALESIGTTMDTVIVEVSLVVTHYDENGEESGTTSIHQLGGNVEVTVKYPAEEVQGKYVIVCYLSDDGSVTYTRATYNSADGTITFKTNHFSTFALMLNEDPVVQVNNGTGDGIYAVGERVTVAAPGKAGYDFIGWEVDTDNVTLADPAAQQVTFTMPDGEVEVTAIYQMRPVEAVWNAAHTALTIRNGCEGASSVMVAFYDNVTGQMIAVRVLTAEEVLAGKVIDGGAAFVNCTARVMFLTGRLIPVADAVEPK